MFRTRAAMLAHLQPSPTGVVLPGVRTDASAVIATVLNTNIDDPAVAGARRAMRQHQARLQRIQQRPLPLASHDARHLALPDTWLTLHIGVPDRLHAALRACDLGSDAAPTFTEAVMTHGDLTDPLPSLFGVPLLDSMSLRGGAGSVGVAALVLRPNMRSAHLVTLGSWDEPTAVPDVLQALQRLVREHLAQWHLTNP